MSGDAWFGGSMNNAALAAGVGPRLFYLGNSQAETTISTEANGARTLPAGSISNYRCFILLTTGTPPQGVIAGARANAINLTCQITTTSGTTGEVEDTTHTDVIAAGDRFVERTTGVSGTGSVFTSGGTGFRYNNATTETLPCYGGGGIYTTAVINFLSAFGNRDGNTTTTSRPNVQMKMVTGLTISRLRVGCDSNGKSASGTTVNLEVNSSAVTSTVTFAASTGGAVEDTTHTDAVAIGDLVNLTILSAASGNFFLAEYGVVQSAAAHLTSLNSTTGNAATINGNTAAGFHHISGDGIYLATEANVQTRFRFATQMQNLLLNVLTANVSTAITWTLRKNASNGTSTVTTTTGATGFFQDTTHKDTIASGDLVAYGSGTQVSGTTSTSVAIGHGNPANSALISTVFGGLTQTFAATVLDVTHITSIFGGLTQAFVADVEATNHGPITTVFGGLSQAINAVDLGAGTSGIRQFWTF